MDTETATPEEGQAAPPPTFADKLNDAIEAQRLKLRLEQARIERYVGWIHNHSEALSVVGIVPDLFNEFIDFNRPTREQVLLIIKSFPGRWEKSRTKVLDDEVAMDYTMKQEHGPTLRIWAGPLPPSCRIVEEEIDVPARKEVRKRIVCHE